MTHRIHWKQLSLQLWFTAGSEEIKISERNSIIGRSPAKLPNLEFPLSSHVIMRSFLSDMCGNTCEGFSTRKTYPSPGEQSFHWDLINIAYVTDIHIVSSPFDICFFILKVTLISSIEYEERNYTTVQMPSYIILLDCPMPKDSCK